MFQPYPIKQKVAELNHIVAKKITHTSNAYIRCIGLWCTKFYSKSDDHHKNND